jgi:hypothetical protein
VRILSVLLSTSIIVNSALASIYSIIITKNLFKSYALLETPRTLKKKEKKQKDISRSIKQNKRKKNIIAKLVLPLLALFNSSNTALLEDKFKDKEEIFNLSKLKLLGNFIKIKNKAKKKKADCSNSKKVLSNKLLLVTKLLLSKTKAKSKLTKLPIRKRSMLSEKTVVNSKDKKPTLKKRYKLLEDSKEDYKPKNKNKSLTPLISYSCSYSYSSSYSRAAKPKRKL